MSWEEMIATAQVVTSYADDLTDEESLRLLDQSQAAPLIAAARILDDASAGDGDVDGQALALGLLGTLGYAMHGNFASAYALANRVGLHRQQSWVRESPAIATALALTLPNQAAAFLDHLPERSAHAQLLQGYLTFLATGSDDEAQKLDELHQASTIEAIREGSFESSVLRLAGLAIAQAKELSVVRVLTAQQALPDDVVEQVASSGFSVLMPPQRRAIEHGLLTSGNTTLSLPTSTGKTLLGALCLLAALGEAPGLACYVTPWVATASQAVTALRKFSPSRIRVQGLHGGYVESAEIDPVDRTEIVVATPERFDALLRGTPELFGVLKAVVIDEGHLVQNSARGVRLEGTIARLRIQQQRGRDFRMIMTSAVLAAEDRVGGWLDAEGGARLVDEWKPTARRVARWRQSGQLEWYAGDDAVRRPGETRSSVIARTDLPWPEPGLHYYVNPGGRISQLADVWANVAYLTEWCHRNIGGPILCVCATKDETRGLAHAIASRFEPLEPVPTNVGQIEAAIDNLYPYLRGLSEAVGRGVAFHNSTVPHDLRRLIERGVAARELAAVVSTTTLAEGVDLPFRVTILASWLMYQADGLGPMTPTMFANIAGRAGRAGSFTDGDTILFDNPVGLRDYAHDAVRDGFQDAFLHAEELPPLTSALSAGHVEPDGPLGAALGAQLLAAIPEAPDVENVADDLLANMLVGQPGEDDRHRVAVGGVLDQIRDDLLDGGELALATHNSPLTLTPLGEAANRSGFSPRSAKAIVQALQIEEPEQVAPAPVGAHMLRKLGGIPEQPNGKLRKVLENPNTRFRVKPDDLEQVIQFWLEGVPPQRIFVDLPKVKSSTSRPAASEWVEGEPAPYWDSEFDQFVDFCAAVLTGFLPWLYRASESLSMFAGGWAAGVPWREWAALLEGAGDEPVDVDGSVGPGHG